jgi:DNA-binding transcriptional LysR family regulator
MITYGNDDMNLNQLTVFHKVAKLQSFTRAADALCLTQPGISKHIKQLEEYYGVRLFDRLGKKVILTQAGEILFGKTEVMFEHLNEAKVQIDDMKSLTGGKICIGASITIGVYVLPNLLGDFIRRYPSIEISLDISLSQEIEKKVLSNALDLGFVGHPVKDERVSVHRFLADELVVIVHPEHHWAKRKTIQPHQLVDQPFLVSGEGSGTRRTIEEKLRSKGIHLTRIMEFGNTECVKKGVEAGLGISIISKQVIAREVSLNLIRSIPLTGIMIKRNFNLIYLKDKYLNHLVQAFLDFLRPLKYPPEPLETLKKR